VQKILQKSSLSILTETAISHIFPDFFIFTKKHGVNYMHDLLYSIHHCISNYTVTVC